MTRARRFATASILAATVLGFGGFFFYEMLESPTSQILGKTVVSGPSNERVVALTYDDGPNPPYTNEILDVLDEEQVHATFFVVGRAAAEYPDILRREMHDGDAIGNHTWDHRHLIVMDGSHVRESLKKTDAAIYAATGVHTKIMRPPFGSRDWLVLDQARRMGYTPVMWSVPLAKDWENPDPAVIAGRILPRVSDGSIIVLHDGNRGLICARTKLPPRTCDRGNDIEATRLIVRELKRQGYRFVTVPELLVLKAATHTSDHANE
jgi:peptidoglycan/xylan/chitin deacetylase (PgdA/CDA1 family)